MAYHSLITSRLSRAKLKRPIPLNDQKLLDSMHPDSKKLFEIAESLTILREQEIILQSSAKVMGKNRFITATAKKLFNHEWQPQTLTVEALKRKESAVGASLFYTGRPNERIEFFNDSQNSWFFYQSITDEKGNVHSTTLHYEVHPNGIMRVSNRGGMKCEFISGKEYDNFFLSATLYHERVTKHVYSQSASLDKTTNK